MAISGTRDTLSAITINGHSYRSGTVQPTEMNHPPDALSRTLSCTIIGETDFQDVGTNIHKGAAVVFKGLREDGPTEYTIFRGLIVDKATPKEGGSRYIQLDCVDDLYRLERCRVNFSVSSQTEQKELYLYFKDDASGGADPAYLVRLSEMREGTLGGTTWVPFEDMDNIPLTSVRRRKDSNDDKDVWFTLSEYDVVYSRKELLFKSAQVDDDGNALPKYYESTEPATPGPGDWEYVVQATFFVPAAYPNRNTNPNTVERILRDYVLTGDPDGADGGAGYPSAKLNLTLSFTKGTPEYITDRIDEGMYVSDVTGDAITVSDGAGFTADTDITYVDVWGATQTRHIEVGGISGNVLTLDAAPAGLIAGMRVHGCNHMGCPLTITGLDTTAGLVNYTDITIEGRTFFIREIRDANTIVVVNEDEDDDFTYATGTGIPSSGTLTYPTIEYTGLQVGRLAWDKDRGTIADLLEWMYDDDVNLLPRNYRILHEPELDIIRGRLIVQERALVTAVSNATGTTDLVVDSVDGFYPGEYVGWQDTSDDWQLFLITAIDYATETITVSGDASSVQAADYIHANCARIHRQKDHDHVGTLDTLEYRIEVISTANQSFPLLSSSTFVSVGYDADPPTGGWSEYGDHADAGHPEYGMVDDTVQTMYLVYRQRTGGGLWDSDPEDWGLDVPWTVATHDFGEDKTVDQILLHIGYSEAYQNAKLLSVYDTEANELPMFTVLVKSEDGSSYAPCCRSLAGREFHPMQSGGQKVFDTDLIERFRYVKLVCDRPFFYKQGEANKGTPTRRRDMPVLNFQCYERPNIRYHARDEEAGQSHGAPDGQITPYIGNRPFAQLTNKGGTIQDTATGDVLILESAAVAAKFSVGDAVALWDTSAGEPFAAANEVASITDARVTLVDPLPGGLVAGDKIGDIRRWLLDVAGYWRDLYAPTVVDQMFASVKPHDIIEEELAIDGWDAQMVAVTRLWEKMLTAEDAQVNAGFSPDIPLFRQVVTSELWQPEMVMGIIMQGRMMAFQTRQFNVTAEEAEQ